ncbi:hypothetical protein BH11PSE8_BH11PSE8_05700 [soil metagenome]
MSPRCAQAREKFGQLDQKKTQEDFVAAARAAGALPGSNGKLGAVGFCDGGGAGNMLATRVPELRVGIPFYGNAASARGSAVRPSPARLKQACVWCGSVDRKPDRAMG